MRTRAVVLALTATLVACSADRDESTSSAGPPSPTAPATTSAAPASTAGASTATAVAASSVLVMTGCPVADEAFCATATDAANALAAGDAGRLIELSRSGTIDCDEVAREYFPGCESQEVLDGYGLSGPDLLVELVNHEAYGDELKAITSGVEPSFADEHGDGAVRVIGVGTCGPDVPDRRTYHLAWTVALREPDGSATRMLGSFEWSFDDEWHVVLTYVGALRDWEALQTNPLDDAFCEAGRNPWRV